MKFTNVADYLRGIESKLDEISHGNEVLLIDLRKDMALERLLSRFDPSTSVVKGGFGVRSLVAASPLTQDVDILIENEDWRGLSRAETYKSLADYVADHMTIAASDQFKFTPTSAAQFIDLGVDQSIVRIWAQVSVADRSFSTIIIDAGIKEPTLPVETVKGRDVLDFAGVANPLITTASREYLIADKITLFLEKGADGDRPRDIVHAAVLLDEGKYVDALLREWLIKFAERRGVTNKLNQPQEKATNEWVTQVEMICSRYRLPIDARACYQRIEAVLDRLMYS